MTFPEALVSIVVIVLAVPFLVFVVIVAAVAGLLVMLVGGLLMAYEGVRNSIVARRERRRMMKGTEL